MNNKQIFNLKSWVGQKVHLGFSLRCMEKPELTFGQCDNFLHKNVLDPDGEQNSKN